MSRQVKIAASLLASDWSRLGEEVCAAQEAGADMIHVDVMDGHFVPNITLGPQAVRAIKRHAKVPLDVHLMIADPLKYAPEFIEAGADIVSFHVESTPHVHRIVETIKSAGAMAGISMSPGTHISAVEYLLDEVDLVLVMTVEPGFGGQGFIPTMLEKVAAVRSKIAPDKMLEVDGGICPDTARKVIAAGANVLVAGSAIFGAENYRNAVAALRSCTPTNIKAMKKS